MYIVEFNAEGDDQGDPVIEEVEVRAVQEQAADHQQPGLTGEAEETHEGIEATDDEVTVGDRQDGEDDGEREQAEDVGHAEETCDQDDAAAERHDAVMIGV